MPAGRPGVSGGFAWARLCELPRFGRDQHATPAERDATADAAHVLVLNHERSNAAALHAPLSHAVNVRSLRRWAKRRTPPPPLTVPKLRECRRLLRKLVSIYRIACATPQPTATERRRTLRKIKTAARRFIESPKKLWADKLLDYLAAADVNTSSILYHEIFSHGHSWKDLMAMKRQLRVLFSPSIYPDESLASAHAVSRASMDRIKAFCMGGVLIVRVLADIELNILVPGSGRWPDPALANLVVGLEPIWYRVTGRTAALISKDKEGELKKCPFADWLGDLLESIGWQRPPVWRVVDIVRSKN